MKFFRYFILAFLLPCVTGRAQDVTSFSFTSDACPGGCTGHFIMFDCLGTGYTAVVMKKADCGSGDVRLVFERDGFAVPQPNADFIATIPASGLSVDGNLAAIPMWHIREQLEESHAKIREIYISWHALQDFYPDEPLATFEHLHEAVCPK